MAGQDGEKGRRSVPEFSLAMRQRSVAWVVYRQGNRRAAATELMMIETSATTASNLDERHLHTRNVSKASYERNHANECTEQVSFDYNRGQIYKQGNRRAAATELMTMENSATTASHVDERLGHTRNVSKRSYERKHANESTELGGSAVFATFNNRKMSGKKTNDVNLTEKIGKECVALTGAALPRPGSSDVDSDEEEEQPNDKDKTSKSSGNKRKSQTRRKSRKVPSTVPDTQSDGDHEQEELDIVLPPVPKSKKRKLEAKRSPGKLAGTVPDSESDEKEEAESNVKSSKGKGNARRPPTAERKAKLKPEGKQRARESSKSESDFEHDLDIVRKLEAAKQDAKKTRASYNYDQPGPSNSTIGGVGAVHEGRGRRRGGGKRGSKKNGKGYCRQGY